MTEKVDQITPDQVARVAMRIFGPNSGNKPTVVAMGRDEVGDYESTMRKYGVST
jgi:mitochondrial-processing peptidase subunit alpha